MPRKARLMYRLSSLGMSLRRIHATEKNGLNERREGPAKDDI
jgi:hypothetical protein